MESQTYDETSREGMRICIELRNDVNANVVLNLLLSIHSSRILLE